ncbi:hypothetical protein SAY86_017736 [Trapa natans]|uniref:Uncharacterized protein n=1 Tax=Trapa natans TaxID=22666 RepID=A0AAN7M1Z2_TRANT|nr:hypothetical protein SAY86_017736 [Trapa natans]
MESRLLSVSCFIMLFLVLVNEVGALGGGRVLDVRKFGAVGDGKSDDSKAFQDAFANACSYTGGRSVILIPKLTFMVNSAEFQGPCKGPIEFRLQGTMKAPAGMVGQENWVAFRYMDRLAVTGGGTFDGFGESAWPYNDCIKNTKCSRLPISFRLHFVNNSVIRGIRSLNSKNFHMNIFMSNNIELSGITITAPAESPNTDGIHIGNSEDIKILNSNIATGDDCISLGPGNRNILINSVKCGPGHGISIGSLGKYEGETDVSGITVRRCMLTGTDNGLRVKTWASDIELKVYNITYDDVVMNDVYNPILIEQQYCPSGGCDNSKASSVQIQDVRFNNVRGTSKSQLAVKLQCSSKYPCSNVNLTNINLTYQGPEGPGEASCSNVRGSASGIEKPKACL